MTPSPAPNDDPWLPLRFLLGAWVGEGSGGPGQGTGYFSFLPDLQGQVIVRKNHADYPATGEGPAYVHDDLMIIYKTPRDNELRAIYFDNEGHIINYTISVPGAPNAVQFLSPASPTDPGFRLAYSQTHEDTLALTFEIALPGTPDTFSTYIQSSVRRVRGEGTT